MLMNQTVEIPGNIMTLPVQDEQQQATLHQGTFTVSHSTPVSHTPKKSYRVHFSPSTYAGDGSVHGAGQNLNYSCLPKFRPETYDDSCRREVCASSHHAMPLNSKIFPSASRLAFQPEEYVSTTTQSGQISNALQVSSVSNGSNSAANKTSSFFEFDKPTLSEAISTVNPLQALFPPSPKILLAEDTSFNIHGCREYNEFLSVSSASGVIITEYHSDDDCDRQERRSFAANREAQERCPAAVGWMKQTRDDYPFNTHTPSNGVGDGQNIINSDSQREFYPTILQNQMTTDKNNNVVVDHIFQARFYTDENTNRMHGMYDKSLLPFKGNIRPREAQISETQFVTQSEDAWCVGGRLVHVSSVEGCVPASCCPLPSLLQQQNAAWEPNISSTSFRDFTSQHGLNNLSFFPANMH
ncbi:uncharacterized protein LOC108664592 [Hyalella azteca]|uniref:Uncharacterized protein LOC108664592 n=1 Tax=Hyalella azteca TaxID=294128 RepID=A0A8B7MYP4_HYAAZ|nr:uncharacterized protein LOC108664592 [Hyalella azteca]